MHPRRKNGWNDCRSANKYEIHEVIDACRYYFEQTGRRITFEYSLVGGVNDTDEDVRNLCRLIKGINCHVNLIPVNPIRNVTMCSRM